MNDFKKFFFKENNKLPIFKWIHYLDIYNSHFKNFKNKNPLILEIGVDGGGSLAMWNYYFKNKCKIIGIDLNPKCKNIETTYSNIKIYIGDQRDKIFLEKIINENGSPDIIIDDGGHHMDEQILSFEFLYKYLSQKGIYLIEDTCTSYWSSYSSSLKNKNSLWGYLLNWSNY